MFLRKLLPALLVAFTGCTDNIVIYCSDPSCGDAGAPSGDDNMMNPGGGGKPDMSVERDMHRAPDLTYVPPPFGTVGAQGGTVSRLLFGVTGDTRPANGDDVSGYPTSVITNIFGAMQTAGAQFAVATGDHQYVISSGYSGSQQQLQLYQQAMQALQGKPIFPVMGNHECSESAFCAVGGYSPGRFQAYMDILVTPYGYSQPYYSFDVKTDNGASIARFILAADTAWDSNQSAWLDQTLSAAQSEAKYIFLFRHYPIGTLTSDANVGPSLQEEESIINKYHYTLLITGHNHEYSRDPNVPNVIVMGLGGAPFATAGGDRPPTRFESFWGYLIVEQQGDGTIQVTLYDQANPGAPMDAVTVAP